MFKFIYSYIPLEQDRNINTYVRMCTYVRMQLSTNVRMQVCTYVPMFACMHGWDGWMDGCA